MRPLEILLPLLLSVSVFVSPTRPILGILLIALLAAHFIFEKYRWQMIPLYALTFALILGEYLEPQSWSALASLPTFSLVALSTTLPALLPVPRIPTPNGPHKVGTRHLVFVDHSRREIYSGENEPRKFMAQIWYPAEPRPKDQLAPWMPNANIYSMYSARFLSLPDSFLSHLQLLQTPAHQNAPIKISSGKYPIILFSHGWMGFRAQNTAQAILLASHGYIVVGFEHPYGSMVTVFPDGSVAPNNPAALPPDATPMDEYEIAARKLVKQWAEDMSFALDQFEGAENEADELHAAIDFSRIGVYGHSTGAGAAIQLCATDARCKAALGMDPFMRPVAESALKEGMDQPSFFMFSEEWRNDSASRNNELFKSFYQRAKNGKGTISIDGTKHYDFSDIPLLSPIAPYLGIKGPLNGRRVTEIVNAYLLEFFEMTLMGKPSALFDDRFTDFPEVKKLEQEIIE